MIWGPFVLALVLGLIVSAGLYFAYLWPSVEPEDPLEAADGVGTSGPAGSADTKPADAKPVPEAAAGA